MFTAALVFYATRKLLDFIVVDRAKMPALAAHVRAHRRVRRTRRKRRAALALVSKKARRSDRASAMRGQPRC